MEKALSLKENIEVIKEELSAEEKFLESVIKTESFYKKNKKLIIGIALAVVVGVVGSMGYNYLQKQKALKANELYMTLLQNKDSAKENELKELNKNLYDLYVMQTALKSGDVQKLKSLKSSLKDPILKDMITYQIASLEKKGLMPYIGGNKPIFKDFASLEAAYLAFENKDTKKAKDILSLVSPTSTFYQLAQSLNHYMKQ